MFTRVALKSFGPVCRTYVRLPSINLLATKPTDGCVEAGYNVKPSQQPRIPVEVAHAEVLPAEPVTGSTPQTQQTGTGDLTTERLVLSTILDADYYALFPFQCMTHNQMSTIVTLKSFGPMRRTYQRLPSADRVIAKPVDNCVEVEYIARPSQQPRIPIEVAHVSPVEHVAAEYPQTQQTGIGDPSAYDDHNGGFDAVD